MSRKITASELIKAVRMINANPKEVEVDFGRTIEEIEIFDDTDELMLVYLVEKKGTGSYATRWQHSGSPDFDDSTHVEISVLVKVVTPEDGELDLSVKTEEFLNKLADKMIEVR